MWQVKLQVVGIHDYKKGRNEPDRVPQCVPENSRQPGTDQRLSRPVDQDAPHPRPLKLGHEARAYAQN